MRALMDTNILIDYLNGIDAAREEISRYDTPLISAITWMEVMVGVTDDEQETIRSFLSRFTQVAIDAEVAEIAVSIRRKYKMRLPDAIIWACAKRESALLVSRNTKDFPADLPDVRMPYRF
ncbi:MAG: VapC toxin family PIN domain ribonuclease [Gammaproteobacteria bacterium]|nr:MAG: VapC toxin family PIN domain ribonuclease [Gammaproteobacteria bacterium]